MTDKQDLVAQLYRADWTRLRLSATISWRRDRLVYQQLQRRILMGHREVFGLSGPPAQWPPDDEPDTATRWATKRRVLLAPGGRYRVMTGDQLTAVCDGESRWDIDTDSDTDSDSDTDTETAERSPAGRTPGSEFSGLLTPQWLIAYYDLDIRAETAVGGRSVIGVAATPRSLRLQAGTDRYHLLDRIDVLIDAEFGFIVRSEQIFAGQTVEVAEMTDLVIDAPQIHNPPLAADPRLFQPPPGMPSQADLDDAAEPDDAEYEAAADRGPDGLGWQAATAAAGLAASAMGFAVRHAPRHAPFRAPRRGPDDAEATMPTDAVLTEAVLDDRLSDSLSAELINLLHRTGLPPQVFAAELHRWADGQPMVDGIRAIRAASTLLNGLLGPDALWQAISERESGDTTHWSGRLRVAMPGRYRLDYLTGNWDKRHRAVACDGEQTTTGYDNRVVTGPARQLEPAIGTLVDPAWLLDEWQLSAAGEVTVAGRRGFRIVARAPEGTLLTGAGLAFSPMEVVVDAELGILLRQISYCGSRPAIRTELRSVIPGAQTSTVGGGDPAEFRIEPEPGMRAVADSGGLFGHQSLPAPVNKVASVATLVAGGAALGAVAVTGWLEQRRKNR